MIDQIREHLDREPFQPFRIVVSSGDRYDVVEPHAVAIAQSYLFYCFPRSDRSAHIRLNQVVAMESLPDSGH
jgi:hypothetical protein